MNKNLDKLHPYPFEKLSALLADVPIADKSLIALSLGEPKHPAPDFIVEAYADKQSIRKSFGTYPPTKGLPALRSAIADFITRRFNLSNSINADSEVLPVSGTREALFSFAQAVIGTAPDGNGQLPAITLMPNPFYQIYEGAALLAGSEPRYLNCVASNRLKPDFSDVTESEWQRCQLVYICTPGNPSGATLTIEDMQWLIRQSDQHDFIIASDECYSEIYQDEASPPAGLLEAADAMGRRDFKNCISFNSLSKRSNLPGLRSGYVCGDANIIRQFLHYRTYHGAAMSVHNQMASIAAWNDETHVITNRKLYREKFSAVLEIFSDVWDMERPEAGFYLWPETPVSDTLFTQNLIREVNVKVLPGSLLSRVHGGINPGENRVRMALVATLDECVEAAYRIKASWNQLT